MASNIVVETGVGLTNANSYLSVVDADTYHANHSGSTVWSGAAEADKEKALRLATQYLDVKYTWKGLKKLRTQVLSWPRHDVYDSDGHHVSNNAIPQALKDACAELALRVIQGDTLLGDIDEPGEIKSEDVKIGPIEESVVYVGGKSQVKEYPLIKAILKPLVKSGNLAERG